MKAPDFDLLGVDGKRYSPTTARGANGLLQQMEEMKRLDDCEERGSVSSMVHLDVAVARILLAGLLECDESLATRGELSRGLERRHDLVQRVRDAVLHDVTYRGGVLEVVERIAVDDHQVR